MLLSLQADTAAGVGPDSQLHDWGPDRGCGACAGQYDITHTSLPWSQPVGGHSALQPGHKGVHGN
jgi:hypothetical protein